MRTRAEQAIRRGPEDAADRFVPSPLRTASAHAHRSRSDEAYIFLDQVRVRREHQ